jgi:hypothetical protein
MKAIGVLLLIIVALGIGVGSIAWFAFNLNDLISNGANFWNIFWVSLIGVSWVGSLFSKGRQ